MTCTKKKKTNSMNGTLPVKIKPPQYHCNEIMCYDKETRITPWEKNGRTTLSLENQKYISSLSWSNQPGNMLGICRLSKYGMRGKCNG